MNKENLKECPFCLGHNIVIDKCSCKVRCKDCFASNPSITPFLKDGIDEVDAAILAWNTREKRNKGE